MRGPGFEPGSSAWKAEILTTVLPTLYKNLTVFWEFSLGIASRVIKLPLREF
jgi:hypothetical protein